MGYRHDMANVGFAERIRRRREELELTQEELAELARISRGTVRNAESGKSVGESTRTGLELAVGWRPSYPDELSVEPYQVLRAATLMGLARTLLNAEAEPDAAARRRNLADLASLVVGLAEDPPQVPPSFHRVLAALRQLGTPRPVLALIADMQALGLHPGPLGVELDPDHRAYPETPLGPDGQAIPAPPGHPELLTPKAQDVPDGVVDREVMRRQIKLLKEQTEWIRGYGQVWASNLQDEREKFKTEEHIYSVAMPSEILTIARSGLSQAEQDGLAMYLCRRRATINVQLLYELEQIIAFMKVENEEVGRQRPSDPPK